MISFEEALQRIRERVSPLDAKEVVLEEALGLCLAEPVVAHFDSPSFDNSAVDGYAISSTDVETGRLEFEVRGSVKAGDVPQENLESGIASRIFTGAAVPPGTGAVVMQEDVVLDRSRLRLDSVARAGSHVRLKGSEFRAGEELLQSGLAVSPALVGLAASQGMATLTVVRRPKVAVVVTGNELVPAGGELAEGQIYESNGISLSTAVTSCCAQVVSRETVSDEIDETCKALERALSSADLVITSGGVSVGDYDVVRRSLEQLEVEEVFWRVAIKPGKPVYFGRLGSKLVFGLPGNPVSALITFELFVAPALRALMGFPFPSMPEDQAVLLDPIRRQPGRYEFLRGMLGASGVRPLERQGSGMLAGLAEANCLIHCPRELEQMDAGEVVTVTRLAGA